jgi:hypothetical protein
MTMHPRIFNQKIGLQEPVMDRGLTTIIAAKKKHNPNLSALKGP